MPSGTGMHSPSASDLLLLREGALVTLPGHSDITPCGVEACLQRVYYAHTNADKRQGARRAETELAEQRIC